MRSETAVDMDDYLESITQASKRARSIVLLLITTSILTFAGFLNSYKYGWTNIRLKNFMIYEKWSDYISTKYENEPDILRLLGNFNLSEPKKISFDSSYNLFLNKLKKAKNINEADYIFNEFKLTTSQNSAQWAWNDFRNGYVRSYIENVLTVRVPFFGISFDINNLGLMSGIAFSIVFILLYLVIGSEISNLKLAFRAARFHMDICIYRFLLPKEFPTIFNKSENSELNKNIEEFSNNSKIDLVNNDTQDTIPKIVKLRRKEGKMIKSHLDTYRSIREACFHKFKSNISETIENELDKFYNFYRLIASRQVFILSFIEGIKSPYSKPVTKIAKINPFIICLSPVFIFFMITINDLLTSDISNFFDKNGAKWVNTVDFIFLALITLLATGCLHLYKEMDKLWDEKLEEVKYYKSYLFILNKDKFMETNSYPKFLE